MMVFRDLLGYIRFFLFGVYTLFCLIAAWLVVIVFRMGVPAGLRVRQIWSRGVLFILGFDVEVEGHMPEGGPYLIVSNHRSSLDPFILLAYLRGYPVSRADVGDYPLVGIGAKITGIMLVEKSDPDSRHATKEKIGETLAAGRSVIIFPEGRTNVEPLTIMFHKGSFEKAADQGVPVVPIALEYKDTTCYWDHEDGLVRHYFKYLNRWRVPCKIVVGNPIPGNDPFALIDQSKKWIDQQILAMRSEWDG